MEQYEACSPEWFCDFENLRKLDEKLREYGHQIQDTHVYFLPEAGSGASSQSCLEKEAASQFGAQGDCADMARLVWYEQEEILRFKEKNRFTSAICFWEGTPDVLAVTKVKDEHMRPKTDMVARVKDEHMRSKTDILAEIEDARETHKGSTESAPGDKAFDQSLMCGMAGASRDGEYLWQIGINVDKEYAGQGLGHELVRMLKEEILRRGKVPFYGTSESHTVSQTVGLKAGFVPAWTEVYVSAVDK